MSENFKNWFNSLNLYQKLITITVITSFVCCMIATADSWFDDFIGCILLSIGFTIFATLLAIIALAIAIKIKPRQTLRELNKMFSDED